jgi:two-component system chemotaxis response regulator CheY
MGLYAYDCSDRDRKFNPQERKSPFWSPWRLERPPDGRVKQVARHVDKILGGTLEVATSQPQLDRVQQRQSARFQRMGLAARAMPGGRSLLVSLPLGPAPFESVGGPLAIERIVFSTVGANQIKCLRPRPVFGLPLLDIRHCATSSDIEARIRQAWRERTQELRETGRHLQQLGIDVRSVEGGSVLAIPLPGEAPEARVLMHRLGEAILPSTGPLGGLTLHALDDRVLEVSDSLNSGADLECLIGVRIQMLLRRDDRVKEKGSEPGRPAKRITIPQHSSAASQNSDVRRSKVLLVGTKLIEDAALRAELKRHGYLAVTARSETEALTRLAGMTPDLVLSQYGLGRSDGASLVQATRCLAGIERIPIVLLDDTHHASRRDAARTVGAAGYLVRPREIERFVAQLRPVIDAPGDRRFTRYPQRLAARLAGFGEDCLATEVGRGGIFVATQQKAALHSALDCEIKLPELGRALHFDGEVLYAIESRGNQHRGLGLRFRNISTDDEVALIEYLTWLESSS